MWQLIHYGPVIETEMEAVPKSNRAAVLARLDMLAMYGLGLRMPHVRLLSGYAPLREFRISVNRVEYRVIFFPAQRHDLVIVRFLKKQSTKTPQSDLQVAVARMREWNRRRVL